jgi:hypothetical protein
MSKGKGKSTFAHVLDLPREGPTCITKELDGHAGLVAEVSSMLAFHPGNGYVENSTQQGMRDRFGQHEIRPRFERNVHGGCGVHNYKYH